jgi:hypothetical protein
MSGSKPVQNKMQKGGKMSGLGGAISAVGGMIGTMAAGMISAKVTDSNDSTESMVGMVSTMAPMIGSMFGPWGMAIGAGISAIGLGFNKWHKTDEELLKEAKAANEELSEIKTNLENDEKTLDTLESNETLFNTLLKGVNQTTGENVSLNDTEWQQYQEILSTVIDSHSELYAAYDAEGNLIAKNAGSVVDLNGAMSESIRIMKEKIRQEKYNVAN